MPTRTRAAGPIRTAAALATSLTLAASLHAAQAGEPQSPTVREYLAAQLVPPAIWRRDNPDFAAGSGQPVSWERTLRLGPNPDVVMADAVAVMENGDCQLISHVVYWWDDEHKRIATDAYATGNVRFSGHVVEVDGTWVIEASGRLPDGTEIRMRDVPGIEQPDAVSTIGHRWNGTEWEPGDEAIWRREEMSGCGTR